MGRARRLGGAGLGREAQALHGTAVAAVHGAEVLGANTYVAA